MNKFMVDFAMAFTSVGPDYFRWQALNSNGEYSQKPENNFSSEFIRHFRNNMELPRNTTYYSGLRCDFDVRKNRYGMAPDIILHEAANTQNCHEIFAEVKLCNTNNNLSIDVEKVTDAVSGPLRYRHGVIVVVNKPFEQTIQEIRDRLSDLQFTNKIYLKKLYLFHAELEEERPLPKHTVNSFFELFLDVQH